MPRPCRVFCDRAGLDEVEDLPAQSGVTVGLSVVGVSHGDCGSRRDDREAIDWDAPGGTRRFRADVGSRKRELGFAVVSILGF